MSSTGRINPKIMQGFKSQSCKDDDTVSKPKFEASSTDPFNTPMHKMNHRNYSAIAPARKSFKMHPRIVTVEGNFWSRRFSLALKNSR